jgi:hypothetical protein
MSFGHFLNAGEWILTKKTSTRNFCINITRNGKLSICSNNIIFPIPKSSSLSWLFYRLETDIFQVCTPFMIILKNTLFGSRKQFI